jgi:hypothetical protein
VRYAQKQDKGGFFTNMTTVSLLLGLARKRNRLFRVGGTNPQPFSHPHNPQNGKTAA